MKHDKKPHRKKVRLGSKLVIKINHGVMVKISIKTPKGANPDKGYISSKSPLGEALLEKTQGEEITYHANNTTHHVKILKVYA